MTTTQCVSEDVLSEAVYEFFATRIFGPDRQELLADSLTDLDNDGSAERERQDRVTALRKVIATCEAVKTSF